MEVINNFDSLFEELSNNKLNCKNKCIVISYADFRKIIKHNFDIGYKKLIEFHHCVFNIKYEDKTPQIGIDNQLCFIDCIFETEFKIINIGFHTNKISLSKDFIKV